jgi:hypothetical protein
MTKWHERFTELDDSQALAAVQTFQARLEDLQTRLADAEREKAELSAMIPEIEATFEESLLGDGKAQEAAKRALTVHFEAIATFDKTITVIRDTLNRERESPELQRLSLQLWDLCSGYRAALIELFPEAQAELERAKEAYLTVVSRIGDIGRQIARLEVIMNKAAGPFLKEKKYQASTPAPAIQFDPAAVQVAYDPNSILAPKINLAALEQPRANADTALAVLRGKT